ncbi:cytochrome p450, family 51 sterol 14-demethylase [Trichoderma arundinaceum]|uniref:Cytochrome p450, family 51 sterol 14-demethylase n=1 Tax=Trichoderma arundinaceum TaxID=490622 RepID=A0A395NBI2_TRIAR|nr:cytochrome p450, family 51 sterol 14-demethylase [Trichoderma arundinaceum]
MERLLGFLVWMLEALGTLVAVNLLRQAIPRNKQEPPTVFHLLPFIGNALSYGIDPPNFFKKCRDKVSQIRYSAKSSYFRHRIDMLRFWKHGDIFTFILLGKKITCYFGINGNDFILNGSHEDLNAEEVYAPLTTPVFGSDVVYDCPNSKLMEQKKFVKFGLTQRALECHVPLIEQEVVNYIGSETSFLGKSGTIDVSKSLAEITIFTAARALQGDEVREKLTTEFATLYHDLDMGFQPINFLMPWAPLPHNRKRDAAHSKMRTIYMDIIESRRRSRLKDGSDMIWNLMNCNYKSGTPVPDKEIAHIMITLLMAGQHTSSSASSWIILHLASRPDITEQLYQEQVQKLGNNGQLSPLQYSDLNKLPLLNNVVKETLRVHSSIHSVMRKVKRPIEVPGTPYVITTDKVLLASPLITALSNEFFPNAKKWDPHRWGGQEVEGGIRDVSISKGAKSPYLPFGAGRHRCIGEKFAYLNLSVIVATIVRNFRLFLPNEDKILPQTDYSSLFSRPKQPALVRWERRYHEGNKPS